MARPRGGGRGGAAQCFGADGLLDSHSGTALVWNRAHWRMHLGWEEELRRYDVGPKGEAIGWVAANEFMLILIPFWYFGSRESWGLSMVSMFLVCRGGHPFASTGTIDPNLF